MKRVLFVDDDAAVLDGLRNRLRRQRSVWEMQFEPGGAEAVARLEGWRPDAVVSDMRMPGMDGSAVLRHVRERHPQAVRIILSGHSDQERMLRSLSVAHQFLAKPCDAQSLVKTLDGIWTLQQRIHSDAVTSAIGSLQALPPLPRLFQKVDELLDDPGVELSDVADVIGQDVSMTARILRYVNSPYFGLSRTLADVRDAVTFLGIDATRTLILSMEWFEILKPTRDVPGYSLDHLQRHSLRTGRLAAAMMDDDRQRSLALSVGMVHDIGSLAMACFMPGPLAQALRRAEAEGLPLHVAEERELGFTHAEVGGYLLSYWGLPFSIVEAVVCHHRPSRCGTDALHLAGAVHIAEHLQEEGVAHLGPESRQPAWDETYARAQASEEKLKAWRVLAGKLLDSGEGTR